MHETFDVITLSSKTDNSANGDANGIPRMAINLFRPLFDDDEYSYKGPRGHNWAVVAALCGSWEPLQGNDGPKSVLTPF